jgi:hypothetical protein
MSNVRPHMCSVVLFEQFCLLALLVAGISTVIAVVRLVPPVGVRRALGAAMLGALFFGAAVGGSVAAVNGCAGIRLEAFDTNADGVFELSEQGEGYAEAEAQAIGDGGRNVLALASPAIGAGFALLLVAVVSLYGKLKRHMRRANGAA